LRKLSETSVSEFVTEIGNATEKETAIVSAGVAVPGKETVNAIVETETERGIEGTENVIEERGNYNVMCFLFYFIFVNYCELNFKFHFAGTRRSAEIVSLSVQKRKKLESSKNLQMVRLEYHHV